MKAGARHAEIPQQVSIDAKKSYHKTPMASGKGRDLFEEFKARIYRSAKLLEEIRTAQALFNEPSFVNVSIDWKDFIAGKKLDVLVRPAKFAVIWNKIDASNFDRLDWNKIIIAIQIKHSGSVLHSTIGILQPEAARPAPGPNIENYQVQRFSNRHYCITCNKADAAFICQGCLATPYCSRECQVKHVKEKGHLELCPKLALLFPKPEPKPENKS